MVYIYILQLEQGKYYIGKTNNPQFRMERHFNFTGSAWGKFEKNRSQILISNTELGILIPYKNNSGKIKKEIINCIPFKYPAQKYEGTDQPWIADKYFK